ncbi:toxin-antitoxin system YwqK family antitoxin [Chitinophaga cymbidii]|uniref:toxin-antitoxin system YwqK family antitoxin n=1 Tax=Chitinophaga cymbidii TaxID=1096750 RepID=UPI0011BE4A66|nr:hypothetical protein [Chitinophaga cymbidii]
MKRTCLLIAFLCVVLSAVAQDKRLTSTARKNGPWVEQVPSIRGEPGYSWEGVYKNDRKEGVWKKYTVNGDLLAEETFKNGVLDGMCKYFYPNGKISATGMMLAIDIEGQKDTVIVIDPVTNEETFTEVVRKGNSVRHGEWRVYDEDGNMMRETYDRGELTNSVMGNQRRATQAPLPHEQQSGARKKRND